MPDKKVATEDLADLFDFDPSIKGQASWLDSTTLFFKPSTRLQPSVRYTASFKLSALFNTPDSLSVFSFGFQTITQSFELDEPCAIADVW